MRRLIARLGIALGIASLAVTGLELISSAKAADNRVYADLAAQIVTGLDTAPMGSLPAASGYGAPSLAVQTIAENGADHLSEDHTRRLLAALGQTSRGRFRFVALESLDELIFAIKAQNLPRDEEQIRIEELRTNARADIFIHGTLNNRNGRSYLSYQAVNTATGELLAATTSVDVSERRIIQVRTTTPVERTAPTSSYRSSVEEAEQLLFEKGYDPGPVDGYLTPETREALRAYQLDSALPVNGRLTRRVVMNLRRDTRSLAY